MGNIFSGWHGRRRPRPYFDELFRVTIADCKQYPPGLILFPWQGGYVAVRKILAPAGFFLEAPRLQCARCGRACTVLHGATAVACCKTCTGARYRSQAESPGRRAMRRAEMIWRRCKIDFKRPEGKPRWQRWPTYERLSAEAERVFPIIEAAECAPYDVLQRVMDMKPRRRGRPKNTAG